MIKKIYDFISSIIADNEPNAKDELYWLDLIFGMFK